MSKVGVAIASYVGIDENVTIPTSGLWEQTLPKRKTTWQNAHLYSVYAAADPEILGEGRVRTFESS